MLRLKIHRRFLNNLTTYKPVVPKDKPAVDQSPNYPKTWSKDQIPKQEAFSGPRFVSFS